MPKIEMEYLASGKLRVRKRGMKGKAPSPDESDSCMLAFMDLEGKKKHVKWEYQGGGGLGSDFWGDEEEEDL